MRAKTIYALKERAGVATHPELHPAPLADLGASFSSWIETDLYLAALVAASMSSPSPETPTRSLDVPGGSSETDRTGDSAWQGKGLFRVPGDTAPGGAPGGGSSPGYTWSSRLRRKLLARRRRPS